MGFERAATVAVATFLASTVLTGWITPPAAARAPDCTTSPFTSVVGVPLLDGSRGGIELRIGSQRKVLTRSALGLGDSVPGDRFGAAVRGPFDADGDSCWDFVVGAPGADKTGVVYVLRGSPVGIDGGYAVRLPGARPGDQFGYSLSVGYSFPASKSVVVAGAPGRDVADASNAGAIGWFSIAATGPERVAVISQATPGVAGAPEEGDRFGDVLGTPFEQRESGLDVLVGVPREDLGTVTDAGVVEQVTLIDSGSGPASRIYRQQGGGPMGVPEAGDRFGSAIAISDDILSNTLAVGVPGEDVGSVKNAGAVNLLTDEWTFPNDVHYVPRRAITQQSARVPGSVEAGDSFGASVEATSYCPADRDDDSGSSSADFAVGAPGENLGRVADAGTVTLYDTGLSDNGQAVSACPSHLIRQDGLAAGHAEAGDRLGADLASRSSTHLLVAVPGEDVGSANDAGLVDIVDIGRFAQLPAEQFVKGPRPGLRYATLP